MSARATRVPAFAAMKLWQTRSVMRITAVSIACLVLGLGLLFGSPHKDARADVCDAPAIASGNASVRWARRPNCVVQSCVLAFSLYGSDPRYLDGAIANAQLVDTVYPGWTMRVYHDDTVPTGILRELVTLGVELRNMTGSPVQKMSWRFTPASDPSVSRFCSRDIDARLLRRDKVAVSAWLASGKRWHVMRDHPKHTTHAMSGGMWCATGDAMPDMAQRLGAMHMTDDYWQDMDFLTTEVWPVARKSVLQHDAFSCDKFGGGEPFPLPRQGLEIVGAVYIDGKARETDEGLLKAAGEVPRCTWRGPFGEASPVVWSNDFHISTIGNVKELLQPFGVRFIDKSLSGHCRQTKSCAKDLKVLTTENGISPDAATRAKFAASYADDAEMATVDVVMCFHPSAMCELFMPLRKRLFVIATTRYEMGRWAPEAWAAWNTNLKAIAANASNLVAANNLYDAEYIEYFTGIRPIVLPSWVRMPDRYSGGSRDVLVAAMHTGQAEKDRIWGHLRKASPRLKDLRSKYGHYSYAQLCENTAIVHIPYQTSVMSLFEQYGMGIPIVVPSPEFLWTLHDNFSVVSERTWEQVRSGTRPSRSPIPGVAAGAVPDPNNDVDKDAFLHWVRFADFYQWPHIVQFDSWGSLSAIVEESDWGAISRGMLATHRAELQRTENTWKELLGAY